MLLKYCTNVLFGLCVCLIIKVFLKRKRMHFCRIDFLISLIYYIINVNLYDWNPAFKFIQNLRIVFASFNAQCEKQPHITRVEGIGKKLFPVGISSELKRRYLPHVHIRATREIERDIHEHQKPRHIERLSSPRGLIRTTQIERERERAKKPNFNAIPSDYRVRTRVVIHVCAVGRPRFCAPPLPPPWLAYIVDA